MSLIKSMQFSSALRRGIRKKLGTKPKKPKKPGLRGGMFAKKQAIDTAFLLRGLDSVGKTKFKKGGFGPFATGRSKGIFTKGAASAQFAKRYPKTDMALGASGYVAAGAVGAWLDDD